MKISALQKQRYAYQPKLPAMLRGGVAEICVKEGEGIEAGQQVARVGSSGKSTGPHLHFEISLNGERLDPMHYISPGGTR